MILWYASLIETVAELPTAIAAAERWISEGGYNPHRFAWECRPCSHGFHQLYASCDRELAR